MTANLLFAQEGKATLSVMKYFLAKTEPSVYSCADLERDGRTVWDGVKNPQALRAIQSMTPGDIVLIYHSGGESTIVGMARVASTPRPDSKNARLTVVDFEFAGRLDQPVTLAEIKASGYFDDWALVRQPRLSTMEVPQAVMDWLRKRNPGIPK
jgi:predicted RNA-binding protein with PUA-like domain